MNSFTLRGSSGVRIVVRNGRGCNARGYDARSRQGRPSLPAPAPAPAAPTAVLMPAPADSPVQDVLFSQFIVQ